MIYQGGDSHFDFQPRMNAAFSDDLIHWKKINNPFPLFLRGESGNWDQGAIWWGETLPLGNMLYMFIDIFCLSLVKPPLIKYNASGISLFNYKLYE
ncbi:MAG: hypothetical protein DRI44_01215 [Chlamydiae bacterium]|nr:MAG: hypothetical protein DRI44_01215 [Chlamydiota bacterium]